MIHVPVFAKPVTVRLIKIAPHVQQIYSTIKANVNRLARKAIFQILTKIFVSNALLSASNANRYKFVKLASRDISKIIKIVGNAQFNVKHAKFLKIIVLHVGKDIIKKISINR